MRVIVVGCGRVGSELAVRLQLQGHGVAIIDRDRNAFHRLPDEWDGQTVVGFGFDRDDLLQAGIEETGALAAVTSGDNTNILTARIARETFEIPYVVARIKDPGRAIVYQRLGIPTVATVSWTVDQVLRRMLPEDAVTAWTDPTGEISIVEHLLPESFCGRGYPELADAERFRPLMVTRGGQARLVGPSLVGQEGDLVHFAVRTDALADLDRLLGGLGVAGRGGSRGGGGAGGAGGASAGAAARAAGRSA
jgi:trk system potassium uptake protein